MIYAVAAFCVLRLRSRLPDHHRPFRVPLCGSRAVAGIVVFGVLALVASVSVANRFDPLPLAVIAVMGALSAVCRRAGTSGRRPPRRPAGPPGRSGPTPVAAGRPRAFDDPDPDRGPDRRSRR